MKFLRGPSDYSQEPPRHPSLIINSQEPFNAEPSRSALISSSYVTPVDLFYKRNHGPVPIVDDIERFNISTFKPSKCQISNNIYSAKKKISNKISLTSTTYLLHIYQCAGNRRTAMSKVKTVKGVGWDVCAIGNAIWGGAKLADVLELVGIPNLASITPLGGKHVEFISVDKCKEENGGPYKASIPLIQATTSDSEVILAYEMNGEPLNRDHGYPLRVIVPGVIGARSVKWLDSINIIAEECQGFFMQKDYKMFPPKISWENIDWSTRRPQMDFPVQSVICSLEDVTQVKPGKITAHGYAVSGGGRGIERVDVSFDGGKTWVEASRYQKTGIPYVADDKSNDKWAWVLFEAEAEISENTEIVAKAVDIAANVQPENVEYIWNLRGILNTSWHRIHIHTEHLDN
ncbi:hypothetical protein SO802_012124 [Lithocarpus litseifolius]|uniref:Sulfite oxidase n=1 Tax=Lithocarpus litseifolius TaxID=425828 RepID=A0AAW2D1W3_9ROSI